MSSTEVACALLHTCAGGRLEGLHEGRPQQPAKSQTKPGLGRSKLLTINYFFGERPSRQRKGVGKKGLACMAASYLEATLSSIFEPCKIHRYASTYFFAG